MRSTVRITLAALLGAAALTATAGPAAAASAYPAPSPQGHTYSIPVGAISDLGDLTKIANLGNEVTGLLGH